MRGDAMSAGGRLESTLFVKQRILDDLEILIRETMRPVGRLGSVWVATDTALWET